MAQRKPKDDLQQPSQSTEKGITRITVGGFKSIAQEHSIEIRPLTILAGANSSGKSSMIQPLLLLKQTLESTFDPGALLLNGPNVKFTQVEQFLSHSQRGKTAGKFHIVDRFHIQIETAEGVTVATYFARNMQSRLGIEQTIYDGNRFFEGMSQDELSAAFRKSVALPSLDIYSGPVSFSLSRARGFLIPIVHFEGGPSVPTNLYSDLIISECISHMLHLPGLRGSPERDYPVTATGSTFPGTFEIYAASIIERWQLDNEKQKLAKLFSNLAHLALTNKVIARRRNATAIELLVNRFRQGDTEDMVSIADVGLGVSQALPVVVALHTAEPGQLVYIEQPEIHLHPRAQYAMAEVLAGAAKEGKRLVIETHSNLLLLGIQTLVAEGKLPRELVKLHWFTQQEDGSTKIDSADLDERGAYGDWSEDFDDVALYSESRYLDAQVGKRGKVSGR